MKIIGLIIIISAICLKKKRPILDSSSTIEQVKKQYRKLAFKYHPDHIADYESFSPSQKQELNAQFLAIVQAYEIILKDQA